MCSKQEYEPDEEAAEYIQEYLTRRAEAHEDNFANAREVRNYIERCISRQATRIVNMDKPDDKAVRTFTIADVQEDKLPADEIMKSSAIEEEPEEEEEIRIEAEAPAAETEAPVKVAANEDTTEVLKGPDNQNA